MNETTDASAIFAPLWRRKWLILVVGLLVSVASYAYYKKEPTVFSAKTQLYLGAASEGQALLNNTLGKTTVSVTALANQAALINSTIGEEAHKRLHREHKLDAARGKVKAKAAAGSDFIVLSGEARTAEAAAQVVNAYAQAYIKRHQSNYERSVKAAIATTRKQIHRIELAQLAPKGKTGSKGPSTSTATTLQSASLSTKLNQLEADLGVTGVQQVDPAAPGKSALIGPAPKKNAIFGFVIGIVLACFAAYILSRFDRRLRSLADIEGAFQLQTLAAVPSVRSPIVRRDGELRPSKNLSEPLRRLQTTLKLENPQEHGRESAPRSLLFISADAGDGKSTLAAGLGLVQRDAGERVALVEADFRRPVQAKLLGLGSAHGLAEVIAGTLPLDAATQEVAPVPGKEAVPAPSSAAGGVASALATSDGGHVSVLVGASSVPNPPALLARPAMGELLRTLAEDFDYVLVDGPPPLQVSDVLPLLNMVDGIVIVARAGHTREASARRLVELLARTPSAPVLGVVANAVSSSDMEKYGFSSVYTRGRWPLKLLGR